MIECPNCSGLNPIGAAVCGNCGANLENLNINVNNNQINNNQINNSDNSDGIVLYEKEFFNNAMDTSKVKDKHAAFKFGDIILFILSILSWLLLPIRVVKLVLAFLFFYIAETSNNKNSVFLVLTRIITAIQIFGIVIAILLKLFASPELFSKYFEYFRF